jgi:hypothetical protein
MSKFVAFPNSFRPAVTTAGGLWWRETNLAARWRGW